MKKSFAFVLKPSRGSKITAFVIVEGVITISEARSKVMEKLDENEFEILAQHEICNLDKPTYTRVGFHECPRH